MESESNTRTQAIDTYSQLRHGARFLDVRVYAARSHPNDDEWNWEERGEFVTAHLANDFDEAILPVGGTGESLWELIDHVNR